MINDIVQLPSRLKQFKHREADISSETVQWYPISAITREFGYPMPDDESLVSFGTRFEMPTGFDAFNRYKIIERTRDSIFEYFAITEKPFDVLRPMQTPDVVLYTLWASRTDRQTLQTKRFIIWENVVKVCMLLGISNGSDFPIESVLANEIRAFASIHGEPIANDVSFYPSITDRVISEDRVDSHKDTDKLTMLASNLRSFNEVFDSGAVCDPFAIYSGLDIPTGYWCDLTPLKFCTALTALCRPVKIKDIRHLFAGDYSFHLHRRPFKMDPLHSYIEISVGDEESGDYRHLYTIFDYISHLPYGEFEAVFTPDRKCTVTLYNPYDLCHKIEISQKDHLTTFNKMVETLGREIVDNFPEFTRVRVTRSWSEEVYITIMHEGKESDRFYFDVAAATIGSRSLIRNYTGCVFALGF